MSEPATPANKNIESKILIETKTYEISLDKDEYSLTLNLYKNNIIQFKLLQKDTIASSFFTEEFNLETINKLSFCFCQTLNEIFLFYDKILQKKKLKVIFLKEKNLMILNFKNIINLDEEVEANIELKEIKLNKEEIFNLLVNEVILLKKKEKNKNNDSINENFINHLKAEINSKEQKIVELEKKIEEMNKNYESKIKKLEEKIEILLEDYEKRKKNRK